jgi:hypothetical protein
MFGISPTRMSCRKFNLLRFAQSVIFEPAGLVGLHTLVFNLVHLQS